MVSVVKYSMGLKQKTPNEQKKATGEIAIVEKLAPCCMPGCCNNFSSK
jgi:hypothetical protein